MRFYSNYEGFGSFLSHRGFMLAITFEPGKDEWQPAFHTGYFTSFKCRSHSIKAEIIVLMCHHSAYCTELSVTSFLWETTIQNLFENQNVSLTPTGIIPQYFATYLQISFSAFSFACRKSLGGKTPAILMLWRTLVARRHQHHEAYLKWQSTF